MTTVTRNQTDEIQVRELIDRWVRAVRAKDVDALMLSYEPDVLLYDLAPPLLYRGANGYRKSWQEWFAPFQGAIGYEIHDLSVSVSDNVAFSTSINRISGTKTGEEGQFDVWIRATVGYRRQDSQWLIAHEHFSVPFYMDGSFKAAIDLKP
jgi:ketosteroid isomerase-like protein